MTALTSYWPDNLFNILYLSSHCILTTVRFIQKELKIWGD